MAKILKAQVRILGVRPLWFHHFSVDSLPLTKTERTGVAGHDPDEWRRTVLAKDNGQLFIESTFVFGCVREAGKYTRKGKGSLLPVISASLMVLDEFVLIDNRLLPDGLRTPPECNPELPVYMDVRGVRNPTTKARNIRYRVACSPGWTCQFHLLWDSTLVNRNEMQAVLSDAGNLVGIGNGRTIGMGRFQTTEFLIME